ncbi:MAG: Uma2 family endonuclease [Acidobacteriaceae bacterium]|nr:Uma2 family endonuclease [Acidobacteriaceae bacterium]
MSSAPTRYITPEEYLEQERKAETRSEYFQGKVFAMAGASRRHARIVSNLVRELSGKLIDRDCNVYSNDLRLAVSQAGLYAYPDVMVVCGEEQVADRHDDMLLNPTLLIEVLSKSTKNYDRGQKFESYRKLTSLREYLTVAQDKVHAEQWVRQPDDRWMLKEYFESDAKIALLSIGVELQLSDIYRKVDFTE